MTRKWVDSGFQAQFGPCCWTILPRHQGVGEFVEKVLWSDTIVLFEQSVWSIV
jgi:hypothetical protein